MDTVPNAARYPIPKDDRLTDLVVGLVGDLLQHHGFPAVFSGPDVQRLRDALSVFLYGPRTPDVLVARACRDNAARFPGELSRRAQGSIQPVGRTMSQPCAMLCQTRGW